MKFLVAQDPYQALDREERRQWGDVGTWPCRWVAVSQPHGRRLVAVYRLDFILSVETAIPLHVTADERYRLFCDGDCIGEGPERGSVDHWHFETYALTLPAGAHRLTALAWSMGDLAAAAQTTHRHGFLLSSDAASGSFLNTGVAPWLGKILPGFAFERKPITGSTGAGLLVDGRLRDWGAEQGGGDGWEPVQALHPGCNGAIKNNWIPAWHRLRPAALPAQTRRMIGSARVRHVDAAPPAQTETTPVKPAGRLAEKADRWQSLLDASADLVVPPRTTRRVILDFGEYQCAHVLLQTSGGRDSILRVHWAEALYEDAPGALSEGGSADARGKGNRDDIDGKCFNWGVPPGGNPGDFSAVLNWHLVYTLKLLEELEAWLDEPELAQRASRLASRLVRAIDDVFWDASRNLYADDVSRLHFSEHAQCLALLAKTLSPERAASMARALRTSTELARATVYFSHYLFETAHLTGDSDVLFGRMESLWFPLLRTGMKTMPEEPEPCRSDCHAWGAHPLYHFYATILGVRPTGLGSRTLAATPCLGPLQSASGTLPHPSGLQRFRACRRCGEIDVTSSRIG